MLFLLTILVQHPALWLLVCGKHIFLFFDIFFNFLIKKNNFKYHFKYHFLFHLKYHISYTCAAPGKNCLPALFTFIGSSIGFIGLFISFKYP
jgi:hypothetical protein